MFLRSVALYLNQLEFDHEFGSDFLYRTRYLCNFVSRKLRSERIESNGFNQICVEGTRSPTDECRIVPEKSLMAKVGFDEGNFRRLALSQSHEFFIEMLMDGLEKCAARFAVPVVSIRDCVDEFRLSGYQNQWIHHTRKFRDRKLIASLVCSLEQDRFLLNVVVESPNSILHSGTVFETRPDELHFQYRLGKLEIQGDRLVMKTSAGKETLLLAL